MVMVLHALASAGQAQDPRLPGLLLRAGGWAESFWRELGSVSCIETMSQSKIGEKGKVISQQASVYDYVIVSGGKPGRPVIEESRLLQKAPENRRPMAFLVTSGFAVLSLVFHPYYQDSFEFSEVSEGTTDGHTVVRVRFSQITGTRSMSALRMRGHYFPLTIKGEAWIDAESGAVLEIRSSLLQPKEELGLMALDSSVKYELVNFESARKSCWVPTEASVEATTRRQHWRNLHQFSAHKHFSVESESSVSK